jgi:hypothetical protein
MYWTVTDESEPLGSMPGNGAFHRKARKMRSDTNDTMRSPNKSFLDTCAPARLAKSAFPKQAFDSHR